MSNNLEQSGAVTPPPPPPMAPYPTMQPPYGYQDATYHAAPPPQRPTTDGLAVASMVLGIVWLYWIGSILAVIFAGVAIKRINASNGWRTGKGMAIAGLVLGIVALAVLVISILAAAANSNY
jgi:hypothetical protein